jgi:hypothetical protein
VLLRRRIPIAVAGGVSGHGVAGGLVGHPCISSLACGEVEFAARWPPAMALSMGGGASPRERDRRPGRAGGARGVVEEAATW